MNPTIERISNKSRRARYLSNQIRLGLRFQLRALRKERNLTQADLAALTGSQQTVISRVENHNADRLSIPTLLKLADALDVGLVIRFEAIDQIVNWYDNLTPAKLAPKSSEEIIEEIAENADTVGKSPVAFRLLSGKNRQPDQPSLFRTILALVPSMTEDDKPTIETWEVEEEKYEGAKFNHAGAGSIRAIAARS